MKKHFDKTGQLDAAMGAPRKVTHEQMLVIKAQVEQGVGDTKTLSRHDFIKLANDAAKLNAELEGRGINFVELCASTIGRLLKDYNIEFCKGKVRPQSRALSEACQRSAYSLAAVVAAIFELYPAIPQLMANTDEVTLALTNDFVETMAVTKEVKAKSTRVWRAIRAQVRMETTSVSIASSRRRLRAGVMFPASSCRAMASSSSRSSR
jgi:hypothetical protein